MMLIDMMPQTCAFVSCAVGHRSDGTGLLRSEILSEKLTILKQVEDMKAHSPVDILLRQSMV